MNDNKDAEFIFKESGGSYNHLRKDEVLRTMDFTYPGWRDENKTFVFPVTTEPTFAGPVTDDTSEYDKGIVKGFHIEVDVLWALKKVSQENALGFRLFHGITITATMLEAIAAAFGDVILLHPAGISVIEIKSNENQVAKAKSQLNKAFDIIKIFLQVIGINSDQVLISRVIALPNPLLKRLKMRWKSS